MSEYGRVNWPLNIKFDPLVGKIGLGPAEFLSKVIFKLTLVDTPLLRPAKIWS
jgi:hypothetical protein